MTLPILVLLDLSAQAVARIRTTEERAGADDGAENGAPERGAREEQVRLRPGPHEPVIGITADPAERRADDLRARERAEAAAIVGVRVAGAARRRAPFVLRGGRHVLQAVD